MHFKSRNGIHTEELPTTFFLTPIISFNRRSFPVFSLHTTACWTWGTCHTFCLSPRFIFGLSRLKLDINNKDTCIKIIISKISNKHWGLENNFRNLSKLFLSINYPFYRNHFAMEFSTVQMLNTLGCFICCWHGNKSITSGSRTFSICYHFSTNNLTNKYRHQIRILLFQNLSNITRLFFQMVNLVFWRTKSFLTLQTSSL